MVRLMKETREIRAKPMFFSSALVSCKWLDIQVSDVNRQIKIFYLKLRLKRQTRKRIKYK